MDKKFMYLAIDLAKQGNGKVNPNPLVGAVIVKDGRVIGQGYHEEYGKAHAEVNAFKSLRESSEGATIYVTLEPCSHYGKTPPCVDKIIENKISKVVIGTLDPNPLVAGRGVRKLRDSGIEVVVGILEEECKNLAEVFMKYIVTKTPFVVLKTAMTLDGKIATQTGESKWITCEKSRRNVHKLRNELSAIMVGVNTVVKDNPELTCRLEGGRNPVRVIVDSKLRIPIESKVINDKLSRTIIATTKESNKSKRDSLEKLGVEIVVVKSKNEKVDLKDLMIKLGELNIDSILLEGGGTLNFSALEEGIIDKVQAYISPKIIGGEKSKTPVEGNGVEELSKAILLENITTESVGEDILIQGYIKRGEN
ncbi:bifunctional diaminohydroxyphosphoribosylaminopyrimidine deaminase/5-amino-6-(5-phosphoribosylamino)uracil reductase RibD [Clostridium sp. NSJ-49]|uniref:bifunctional diaminohydroxyphosphoribosylaminopyrimidine deaminase/5-amino-6-(5-phosphoribosylamino)uracil reductase RibD n=1 Tax=Clostridium TaxID=1485 RepID=UPI00164B5BE9|nr:bifunctional diaminohydroxyphosphoribosylaminopyrimidine deaminase/5-amino-6-(5-phosphoribosylamino)uracil reductase RibD [Clostridium sp. NSJ-49]